MLTFGPVDDIDSRDWVWAMSGLGRKGAHRAATGARGPGRTSRRANRRTSRFLGREPARFERGHGQRRPGAARGWLKYLATRALGLGKEAAFRGPPRRGGGSRTFARGMVCAGAEVWPTPAAPLMMSASNLSALSSMPALACVRVSAPLIPDVALVLLPPRKGHLSRSMTRPPCSRTVCAAESPARPPPMTMTCSAMARVFLL